ncbi:MAG: tyrosine-type recombinase/integrase [Beijerinckiaceae bacterium]
MDAQGRAFAPLVKERRALTDDFLEKMLAFPRYTTFLFSDTETNGLQCRLGKHRATWLFYHDDRRHRRRKITSKRLGFFPAVRTEEARDSARIERGRVAAGDLSPGRREAIRVDVSLTEYIAYLERKAGAKGKPARWATNVRALARKHILPKWGQWSLNDLAVHPGAVADWHADITENNGPVTANQACRIIRAAYRRSSKRDVSLPQRDPCSAVEYNAETPAQKAMAFRDFPKWLKAWRAVEVGPKAPARRWYHLFCLLTGMRPGEAARIRWRDVKPARRVIEVAGAKADNTIQIVMSAPIARVLKRARDVGKPEDGDAFVFAHCGHAGHRDDLPTRGHAHRHTWRTVAADCGVDELLAHLMLGHVPRNISQAYITRFVLATGPAIRQAQRKVSRRILQLLGSDPTLKP